MKAEIYLEEHRFLQEPEYGGTRALQPTVKDLGLALTYDSNEVRRKQIGRLELRRNVPWPVASPAKLAAE